MIRDLNTEDMIIALTARCETPVSEYQWYTPLEFANWYSLTVAEASDVLHRLSRAQIIRTRRRGTIRIYMGNLDGVL